MWKQQKIHDYLVDAERQLVNKDHISVYADQGTFEWAFDPVRQSFGLTYVSNILVREFTKPPHLLFLCFFTGLAEIDPNPEIPHDPKTEASILKNQTVDIEIKLTFREFYEYHDAEDGETADATLGGVPVVLKSEEMPPRSDRLERFGLIMDSRHHL